MSLVSTLVADVFVESGWSTAGRDRLSPHGFSFDAVFESAAAIVFFEELDVSALRSKASSLSGEVAAVTQRGSVGSKAWEGYLLLACRGDLLAHERDVQAVQHDLSYCRKIVISVDEIELSDDPKSRTTELLSFLFPLELETVAPAFDVRAALVSQLTSQGVEVGLAADLVGHFDDDTCRCADLLVDAAGDGEP